MAKRKLDSRTRNRYLSLAFPENISFNGYDDSENEQRQSIANRGNIGNKTGSDVMLGNERRNDYASLARDSSLPSSPTQSPQSNITPGYSGNNIRPQPNSNIVKPAFARPGMQLNTMADTPESSLPNFARDYDTNGGNLAPVSFAIPETVSRFHPQLFGDRVDLGNVARAVLSDNQPASSVNPAARESGLSPEEKLLATLANTNPTPSGFWKRLLVGVGKGAEQITPGEPIANSFGKIVGNVVARSIPQVDAGMKFEETKRKALEDYRLESGARDARLRADRTRQDIANDAERIRSNEAARQRQQRIDAEARIEKLTDNRRAEAEQRMRALEKLPEDDAKRDELSKELQDKYGINLSRDYGLLDKSAARGKSESEDQLRKRAEADVTRELGATTKERARGATKNTIDAELKQSMPPDLYAALTDPNASAFKRAQALKMRDEIEDRSIKRNEAYTDSDFQRRVTERMEELRGAVSNKPVTRSKQATSNKVAPSNKAQATDFRTLKFK